MQPLDQFDDDNTNWLDHWAVLYLPIAVFIGGVLMRLIHWPGSSIMMSVGLFLLLIRSALFFFRKKRDRNEWIYFVSRVIFTLALGLQLILELRLNSLTQITVIGIFVVGAYVRLFTPFNKKDVNQKEAND